MRPQRIIIAIFFLGLSTALHSQSNKILTLEDAVLKQSGELSPSRMNGLEWLNETTYMFKKGKGEEEMLLAFDLKKNKEVNLLSLEELNKNLKEFEVTANRLPSFQVVGSDLVTFQIDGAYFLLNTSKGKLKAYGNETEGIEDVHFSKDANYMAYVKENNVYVDALDGEAYAVTTDGSADLVYGKAASRSEFGISEGIFWGEEDFGFAYYRNDQSAVTTYPLVDLNLTPAGYVPLKYPMAGGASEKVTLELNFKDQSKVKIKTNPDASEDAYICSANWTPDGKQIVLVTLNRDQNHAKYKRYNSSTGELIGIEYEEEDDKYVEPLFPLIFTKVDGSEYVYLSQKDGWMHAYLKSATGEKQLTKGRWVITKFIGANYDKSVLYFEGTSEDATENHIYKVDVLSGTTTRISKNHGTYHAKLSPGGKYLITYFSNIETPGRVLIADADGIVIKQLLTSPDPLIEYHVSRPELLTMTNRDGLLLHARMIKPHDFDSTKKYPVLVYVYNGPHVQLVTNSWWGGAPLWMSYMAEQGYIVFTVDGRGSYNRGKEFEQFVFRILGEKEMRDQIDGVKYLKSLPYVNGDQMAVHGWSFGGYMTTSLMLKYPNSFKVGVAGGPVTNWKYYEVMYTERYMDTPENNPDGFRETDLSNHVGNLTGKLLLIHGMSDDVVVPQHNLTLIKSFVDQGKQVDFFPYPGHPHNVRGKDRLHLMTKVLNYIQDNIEK